MTKAQGDPGGESVIRHLVNARSGIVMPGLLPVFVAFPLMIGGDPTMLNALPAVMGFRR